ncbi:MAG: hydroxymethylglutaryl-CoA reductase, degradative [Candidatus Thermoplasmatota archaeon]|jgi:hydroxymethylglutaryl-CoA reductase|nr:hydroxymethylglutaryl-CoA reductase, degradative [Candidatus Thermoplasmatota archaeon]
MSGKTSEISGFYKLTPEERAQVVARFAGLNEFDIEEISKTGSLPLDLADKLIENVISTVELPVGIAVNFLINGRDYLIPMAIEEASVVAACSNAAKIARASGGFQSTSSDPVMIGQVQLMGCGDFEKVREAIEEHKGEILDLANSRSRTLSSMKAGARDVEVRKINDPEGSIVLHLKVDVRDAMGANVVNSMCEAVAPFLERITGCKTNLRILSNLTPDRIARSKAKFRKDLIGGEEVVKRIIRSYEMADVDPYRAATHNKGIMNGVDAVILATMNDWRSAEANAHTYHNLSGHLSLTRYSQDENGDLIGEIEIPVAVGTVGGSTNTVKKAAIFRKILSVGSSSEFAQVLAAVGLAQNFAALRALSAEGIQKGHMGLHARSLAVSVGAKGDEIDRISETMVSEGNISMARARDLLESIRKSSA